MSNNHTPDRLFNMTPKEILAYLDDRIGNKPETVPAGWHTIFQLAKAWNISDQHTGKRVNLAVREGLMEKRTFRVMTCGGMVRPVAHFRLVGKGKG